MKRRFSKVGFNTKLIIDVMLASLIVQKAPGLLGQVIPLDDSLKTVAGVGVGYLAGSMLKKPDLANASIALGVIDFISPMVDGLLGTGSPVVPVPSSSVMVPAVQSADAVGLADVFRLRDYVPSNVPQYNSAYKNSY